MIDLQAFPATFYHPVHGAKTVETPEDAAKLQPATDWFATAAEADAHRTENEAAIVIHNARTAQVARHEDAGVVKHSVTHQETVDRQVEQSAFEAEAEGREPPKEDETRGAELLS